jgi:hypothetical protein
MLPPPSRSYFKDEILKLLVYVRENKSVNSVKLLELSPALCLCSDAWINFLQLVCLLFPLGFFYFNGGPSILIWCHCNKYIYNVVISLEFSLECILRK